MFDLHTHSRHSCDARSPMVDMVAAARKAGLAGMAITDHVEWVPRDDAFNYLNPAAYFDELAAARAQTEGELTLLAGVELGNPHDFPAETAALLSAWPWDYVLGSVHWPGGLPGWKLEAFQSGLEAAYRVYFDELVKLATTGEFDIASHFDLVRRDSTMLFHRTLPLDAYAEPIRAALRALVARGKGLEINTSGQGYGLPAPLPYLDILRWYRELGGEILVFGSDAHNPEAVGRHFDAARELALAAGFTRLARFEQRRIVAWLSL